MSAQQAYNVEVACSSQAPPIERTPLWTWVCVAWRRFAVVAGMWNRLGKGGAGCAATLGDVGRSISLIAYGALVVQRRGSRRMAARKTPTQIRLGQAVKHVRNKVGMTQEQLANKINMHATYISDIERGARNPSWEAITRLAKGMGVGVAEIAAAYDRRSK